jgi:hypothetical protein
MSTKIITFPFTQGQDEDTNPRELPEGKMREATNVRQYRGSAMGQRPDYPAVSMDELDGTLVPYDIYSLNGRLVSLGDRNSADQATDVFNYIQQPAGAWAGTAGVGATSTRVPAVTKIRNIGQPPDGVSSVAVCRVAAVNGIVCLTYSIQGTVGGLTSYVHIFDAETDSTILFTNIPLSNAKVVDIGDSFWIVGVNSTSDLAGYRFDTTADSVLQSPVTFYTGTVTQLIYDAMYETRSSGTNSFLIALRDGSTTPIRRINESGSVTLSITGPAVAADVIGIEGNRGENTINLVYRVGAADANIITYNGTTGAVIDGPDTIFGQAVTGDLTIARRGLGDAFVEVVSEDSFRVVRRASIECLTHATTVTEAQNYLVGGKGVYTDRGVVVSPFLGATDNQLVVLTVPVTNGVFQPVASTDLGIAADALSVNGSQPPGQVARDFTTEKFYWARLVVGTDGQQIPTVSEFEFADTGRRQACQIGNALFISGGLPLSYDGRQLVESGFIGRPSIDLIAETSGGSLIPGATYDYCLIWRWIDSQNLEAKSAVSLSQTVTLTPPNRTATNVTVWTPHTLRRDTATGSTATVSLYRTVADGELTAGFVTSARDWVTSPGANGDFTGLTLIISIDGGSNQTFTFTGSDGASAPADMRNRINLTITGGISSIDDNGFLVITSNSTGSSSSVEIIGGTTTSSGVGSLGFFVGQLGTGLSTFTRGTVFHKVASYPVPLTNDMGEPITIFDSMSDTTLLTQETLYTNGERGAISGILENNPPLPCEFCWSVGNRVFIGGLPNRSEVRISKALFPAESVSFSDDFAFCSFVDGDVTAVASLDGTPIAFTKDCVYAFSNQLPDDNGNGSSSSALGALGEPMRIPSEGGCINPFSLVEVSFGLFYQSRDNKIMLLPRGGAAPIWTGGPVQDTLNEYPLITGAAYCDMNHTIVWSCMNTDEDDSVLIILDIKTGQWSVDIVDGLLAKAVTDYDGRLAIIDDDVIKLESTSRTPSTFITYNMKSGSHQPFSGNGWGKLTTVAVMGEFLGNCKLQLRISYDDGATWTTLSKVFDYTTPTFTVGQTVVARWSPNRRKCSQFVLDFHVLPDAGSTASPGLNLTKYTVELEGSMPQKVRLAGSQQG